MRYFIYLSIHLKRKGNPRFTSVPLKALSKSWVCGKYQNSKPFKPRNTTVSSHICDHIKVSWVLGTVVNQALLSLHGGSLEITLTVPLPVFSIPCDTYFRCLFFEHFSITDFLFHFKNKEILVQLYLFLKQNPEMSPWTLNISPSFSLNYS